jgi:hypothetical protein
MEEGYLGAGLTVRMALSPFTPIKIFLILVVLHSMVSDLRNPIES